MQLKPGQPEDVGISSQRARYLRELAKRWVAEGELSGLVVLAARRGTIVLEGAFGQIAPETTKRPGLDTLVGLGSASTLITITAAMILVDDGLLGLNRPVYSYLPEFQGQGKEQIMVHHLLRHTSGLRDLEVGFPDPETFLGMGQEVPLSQPHPNIQDYFESKWDTPLNRAPDSEMSYGHYTVELLGEIIRRISGQTLPVFCRERIFEPLGMGDTTFTLPASQRHRLMGRPTDAPHADTMQAFAGTRVPWAFCSVFSSPRDLAILGQTFLNGGRYGAARVLSRASVQAMTQNQVPGLSAEYRDEFIPEASWGLGWNVHTTKRALGDGTLQSPQAYYQGNAGGLLVWVDPVHDLLGVYCGAPLKLIEDEWPGDLFMNAVTASLED